MSFGSLLATPNSALPSLNFGPGAGGGGLMGALQSEEFGNSMTSLMGAGNQQQRPQLMDMGQLSNPAVVQMALQMMMQQQPAGPQGMMRYMPQHMRG